MVSGFGIQLLLPAYTMNERLNSFVSSWITPITGLWTFIAGVSAVVAPYAISAYRKKQKDKHDRKKQKEKEEIH
jgi:hypothetical protein